MNVKKLFVEAALGFGLMTGLAGPANARDSGYIMPYFAHASPEELARQGFEQYERTEGTYDTIRQGIADPTRSPENIRDLWGSFNCVALTTDLDDPPFCKDSVRYLLDARKQVLGDPAKIPNEDQTYEIVDIMQSYGNWRDRLEMVATVALGVPGLLGLMGLGSYLLHRGEPRHGL